VALADSPARADAPVARVRLGVDLEHALAALETELVATEFTAGLLASLRQAYRQGAGMATAFGAWLESVLGPRGLIVFDASDPAAKPLAGRVFAQEIERAGDTAARASEAGVRLEAGGYHAQVTPTEGSVALFHLNDTREPIRSEGNRFTIGATSYSKAELSALAAERPQEFSPNVLLRPVVQDSLFPTVCYVAGPNELGYLAQLGGVYRAFGVPMPLFYQRASATLLDSNSMRFLLKHDVPFEALQAQDESVLNHLLAAQLPPTIDAALEDAGRLLSERMSALAAAVPQIDPTLEAATRSALGRMQDDLKKLHGKIVQAAKRKDDTLRRQFTRAQSQAFPAGHPQEREVGFVYFLNRYGIPLVERLNDELTLDMGIHWVIGI
jgi:bacillithiol biosynthesis cysteine-adding enzyme BshC